MAELLFKHRNVLLRAPTGAGKTWSVLVPFFCDKWEARPTRLIYALPLRTLAQGIYREAVDASRRLGKRSEPVVDPQGRETVCPFVTLQTGEQPDDPFFDRGTIIVTTYDQVLSGLLCGPYGLSDRLHNINASAIAGALVVFDEFHLMPPDKAFLTAAAGLRLFRGLCQSVWMTATATAPLEQMLRTALDVVCVPDSPDATRDLLGSLPSVTSVSRTLLSERVPLSAEAVLSCHNRRSIVLANTVGRAQVLFEDLRRQLSGRREINLTLLHSRFFKTDRQRKEASLKSLFGPGTSGSAILVSTQVIEAGVDISCENLHTELCAMNALVQRAGRCARFSGETGAVHVYPLPDEPRAWLPYGDINSEATALARTRDLLCNVVSSRLDPTTVAEWVQAVHGDDDAHALRPGWTTRTNEALDLIFQNAIQRDPAGIAYIIRGEDSESIRIIVASRDHLPKSPGNLESISMPRWSLARHISGDHAIGWYWDGADDQPWKPLVHRNELAMTYAVSLCPEIARYDSEHGLRLGMRGDTLSPLREEPKRPGYAPLREEPWLNHARMVAEGATRRIARDCDSQSFLAYGLVQRFGLAPQDLRVAASACGLLHDLGKLQLRWQQWAEAIQRSKDQSYKMTEPLAHTDFDPDSADDRKRERSVTIHRPPHAACSAYWSLSIVEAMLRTVPEKTVGALASACVAAILSHHGAFLPKRFDSSMEMLPLIEKWEEVAVEAANCEISPETVIGLEKWPDKRGLLTKSLDVTTARSTIGEWWPLVAFLIRTLRLSDQRATSEWACG